MSDMAWKMIALVLISGMAIGFFGFVAWLISQDDEERGE